MFVKTPAKVSGIPTARVAVSPGVTDQGMPQVNSVISAYDAHGMPTVVASLRMSSAEAREVAQRLLREADVADRMAKSERDNARRAEVKP